MSNNNNNNNNKDTAAATAAATAVDHALRDRILSALLTYAQQKPRLERENYADAVSYRAEMRRITRDLGYARQLIAKIRASKITAPELLAAFDNNRLSWDGERLEYITGQYWPTEYRNAVCTVAAAALRRDYRGYCFTGADIAAAARLEFSRAMVARFFCCPLG